MIHTQSRFLSQQRLLVLAVFVVGGAIVSHGEAQAPVGAAGRPPASGRGTAPLIAMSPKAKSPGWTGVHRPHTKFADVLVRHKGTADWTETIVDDESLNAQWVSMAPDQKTPRRMNGDTREWWIVQAGTLRFTVEAQDAASSIRRIVRSSTSPRSFRAKSGAARS